LITIIVLTLGAVTVSASTATVTIRVEGMHCGNCSASIQKKLKATAGVEDVRVSFEKKEAWVKFDDQRISVAKLREIINSTGFKAVE
jgi:copper chaperone CopZ